MRSVNSSNRFRKVYLPGLLLVCDTLVAFLGMCLGYWLRYNSSLGAIGISVPNARFAAYFPLVLLGTAFLVGSYSHLNLYEERFLLRKFQSLNIIIKGTSFWFVAYLGLSLVLKFQPPISRLFVGFAYLSTIAAMFIWRNLFYAIVSRRGIREKLQQRVALLGWNAVAESLTEAISKEPAHPFQICGAISLPGEKEAPHSLGAYDQLPDVLAKEAIDILIATRTDFAPEQLHRLVELCETRYVEWKIIPSSFQIFLTGLRLQTIGRLPILGVEDLTITKLFNRGLKRLLDVIGATIGLICSTPVILVFAALIKRESPKGAVLFRQERVGAEHQTFTLYKLRSMTPDASSVDHTRQSTARNDPRLLRVGSFMRRWNIDELPQFWNVLKGEMSLVGPRPERPYHVDQLTGVVPHYLPRHLVKPGMTGWAQINGLRGEGSMDLRAQYDIYYIENWSLWLDLQIIAMTFMRWKNPAE